MDSKNDDLENVECQRLLTRC